MLSSHSPLEERQTYLKLIFELVKLAAAKKRPEIDLLCGVMRDLLRRRLELDANTVSELLNFINGIESLDWKTIPVAEMLNAVEWLASHDGLSPELRGALDRLSNRLQQHSGKQTAALKSLLHRLDNLLSNSILSLLKPDGGWADRMVADLAAMPLTVQTQWTELISHLSKITPAPPAQSWEANWSEIISEAGIDELFRHSIERSLDRRAPPKWHAQTRQAIEKIGEKVYLKTVATWLDDVPNSKPGYLSRESINREIMRGLIWGCLECTSPVPCAEIGLAADFFFKNNSPLGLACVVILARLGTADALGVLTVIAGRVRTQSHQMIVAAARERVAERLNIPLDDLDDFSIPTSNFTDLGVRRETLAGFGATITIDGRQAKLQWFKPNGEPQKSVPAVVKRDCNVELKLLKCAVREVETTLLTVKKRFEEAPLNRRSWSLADWRERFADHPIAGTMVRRLIWDILTDNGWSAAYGEDGFVDVHDQRLNVDDNARIAVWHPLGRSIDQIQSWREWLLKNGISQPFKQAHREIYLLTPAEEETETYSNRFAAHILKQSQFRTLAKSRGWKADYMGGWDGGDQGVTQWKSQLWDMRAELWCGLIDGGHADAGGYLYIATDQVRFYQPVNSHQPMRLADVPPLVLSEVFRDVDLFVGVASVGNDPNWNDGGLEGRFRDYWSEYAFGELTATADIRKNVLDALIPRLKIADRCRIDGRYLIVRGDMATYKIHLGSSNIMMEPSKYLCIVPDRAQPSDSLMLPFDDDRILSVILSKAFLLAQDTAITDQTIVRQIRQGLR